VPDRLSRLLQIPQRVTLGGAEYTVYEARLCDLAQIQAWLDDVRDRPLAEALRVTADPELTEPERDRLLFGALDPLDGPRPTWRNAEGDAMLCRGEGLLAFLAVALHRGQPGMSADDLVGVAGSITPAEFLRLRQVFYGGDPEVALTRRLFAKYPAETRARGKPVSWLQAVADFAQTYPWSLDQILGLTLSQFTLLRNGGAVDEDAGRLSVSPDRLGEVQADLRRRREAAFGGGPHSANGHPCPGGPA